MNQNIKPKIDNLNPLNPPAPPLETNFKTPKKKNFWKILGIIFLSLLIVLSGAYGYINYRFKTAKDIPPIDDSDLRLLPVTIPDKENSYFTLIKTKDFLNYPANEADINKIVEIEEGKSWDEAFVREIISKNQEALTFFDQFDQMPKFVDPITSDPEKLEADSAILSGIGADIRKIARIQSVKSLMYLKEGKSEPAFNEAEKILRISYKLTNYQPSLVQYLLGLNTAKIAWKRLDLIINSGNLSSDFKKQKKVDLIEFKSTAEGLKKSIQLEYMMGTKTITEDILANPEEIQNSLKTDLPLTKMPPNFYFQPNRTKLEYANWSRELIKQTDKPCDQIVPIGSTNIKNQSKYKLIMTENVIGKLLVNMITEALSSLQDKRCQTQMLAEEVINKIE